MAIEQCIYDNNAVLHDESNRAEQILIMNKIIINIRLTNTNTNMSNNN